MAGKKMKLDANMMAFSKDPLHQRTVNNWRESVVGIEDLRVRICNRLEEWFAHHEQHMQDVFVSNTDAQLVGFIFNMVDDIYAENGRFSNVRVRFAQSGVFEINGSRIDDFNRELARVEWGAMDGVNLMLLLLTYRTFIQEKVTPIPGLPFNITIPGCVYTCFRLGIGVEA